MHQRRRYILLVFALIGVGLLTRRFAARLSFFGEYAPDAIWAMMVYFILRFALPTAGIGKTALSALLFAYGIELSQIYHAPWIDHLRSYRVGGLVLGQGFLWSDLACYASGVCIAVGIDRLIERRSILRKD